MPCRVAALAILVATLALPLAGAWIAHTFHVGPDAVPWRSLFSFPPPLDIPTDHPRFSWSAFGAVVAVLGALGAAWRHARTPMVLQEIGSNAPRRLPTWGWLALAWTTAWWVLAWTRNAWFAPWQAYTFFPLWLGFIVGVNALTEARGADCLLRRAPAAWLALFAASAGFWWVFEWLNRFVRNWHYLGAGEFGPWGYAVHATLCFSTVLPAVTAVSDWLRTFPRLNLRCAAGPRWSAIATARARAILIVAGLAALLLTGIRPRETYPALWVAPLMLTLGAGAAGITRELAGGDWRRAATWMLAALVCGFFWELWNWRSVAKWIYTVPYVDRWHVFEMPIAGYAGYLPFGLECLLVADWVLAQRETLNARCPTLTLNHSERIRPS
ncbi:MAG TPA: hypothetical protein VM029_20805 [Opitutaceae bacterium]|nr:hypothetical protein [Opitutaceae bacterium]